MYYCREDSIKKKRTRKIIYIGILLPIIRALYLPII